MINLGINQKEFAAFVNEIKTLRLTGRQKQKIVLWTLRAIKRKSAQNIKKEQSPNGQPWAKRKPVDGEVRNKKLLKKVLKYAGILADERGKGRIRYRNPVTGDIALKQQEGFEEIYLRFATDKNKGGSGNAPATLKQAHRLRELGYRKRNGKGKNGKVKYRLYRVGEIRQKLTRTWASMEIRRLSGEMRGGSGKTSWKIPLPARPFLDMREKENTEILREITLKFLSGEYQ